MNVTTFTVVYFCIETGEIETVVKFGIQESEFVLQRVKRKILTRLYRKDTRDVRNLPA